MNFDQLYEEIERNYENHLNGYHNCIPFDQFPRLCKYVPGIIKGEYYLITGSSGSAKSKISRNLFLHNPYNYILKHPELNIKLDVLYWSLEEDPKKIIATEVSRLLKTRYDLSISYRNLRSIGPHSMMDRDTLEKIRLCKKDIDDWQKHVHIFGAEESNPTGIFKAIRDFAYKNGKYYTKDGNPFTEEMMQKVKKGEGNLYKDIDRYKLNDDRHYVIVLIDHLSLVKQEKAQTKREAMEMISEYVLMEKAKNLFGFTPVIVQQQNSVKEKMQFTSSGESINEKLEPSLDSLADCTTTQREATIAMGIFGPARYAIEKHNGYDITILKDYYRSLSILKQRDEKANLKLPLLFDGASDYFTEAPLQETKELRNLYERIKANKNTK